MPELTQEQYDELMKKLRELNFQVQSYKDTLEGGITSRNLMSFRNTYVINAQDSLDNSYPMYVHFNIISEMIKVVSVKVDFWILNYRAYSKAGAAAGTPSGGGDTSGTSDLISGARAQHVEHEGMFLFEGDVEGIYFILTWEGAQALNQHTHSTPDHTHPNHTHTATYGIFEEDTSPTIKFYVSENAGVTYSDVFGPYTVDKSALDITSLITSAGSKLIKFESDVRARLSIQVEIKLDIRARG